MSTPSSGIVFDVLSHDARNRAHERGFPRAVDTERRHDFAALDM